jgi:hypothetical protein
LIDLRGTFNHLIVQPRADLNFDSEAIWLEIVFPAYKMLLCAVYRQPNANYPFWDKLLIDLRGTFR